MNKQQKSNAQPDSPEEEIKPTLGEQFRLAREKTQLTIEEIATQLFLSKSVIEEIESDCIPLSTHSLYSKGYVKSYSQLLNLPTDEILKTFESQYQCDLSLKKMQTFSNRSQNTAHNNYLNWITSIVIFIMIFGVSVWWWKQQDMMDTPMLNTVLVNTNSSQSEQISSDIEETQEQAAVEVVNSTFTFSKDCWVKITDATNAVVAIGIQKAGSSINISGIAPLEVVLGASHAVKITYQQEPVDISSYTSQNTATFTLPLEQ